MGAPISEDLRQLIVAAWQKKGLTGVELAELFGVGVATVVRIKRLYVETGTVKPKPHGGGMPRIIAARDESLVEAMVRKHPDWSEEQYAKTLAEEYGIVASAVTVGRTVRKLGYSVKKRRSSPRKEIAMTLCDAEGNTSKASETSQLRVWFLWTKPARTRK
jgi:transposase